MPSIDVRAGLAPGELFLRSPRARPASVAIVPAALRPSQFRVLPLLSQQGVPSGGWALVRVQQQPWPQDEIVDTLLMFGSQEDADEACRELENALVGLELTSHSDAPPPGRSFAPRSPWWWFAAGGAAALAIVTVTVGLRMV